MTRRSPPVNGFHLNPHRATDFPDTTSYRAKLRLQHRRSQLREQAFTRFEPAIGILSPIARLNSSPQTLQEGSPPEGQESVRTTGHSGLQLCDRTNNSQNGNSPEVFHSPPPIFIFFL